MRQRRPFRRLAADTSPYSPVPAGVFGAGHPEPLRLKVPLLKSEKALPRHGGTALGALRLRLPDSNTLDAQVDSRALTGVITRWLDELPPRDRELFVRRYWFCDSLSDVAARMEETPQALSQRAYQLRRSLKNHLEKEGYTI